MEFLEISRETISTSNSSVTSKVKDNTASKQAYEQSKERERERRKLQNAVMQKEKEIETLEEQIAAKDNILATGQPQDAAFYQEYQHLKDELELRMSEWEEAVIAAEG